MNCLNDFSGECYIPEQIWLTNEAMELFTDSVGNVNLSCGTYFADHWIQFKWPESWAGDEIMRNITLLELVHIIFALFTWESHFTHKKIVFRVDNMALVTIISKEDIQIEISDEITPSISAAYNIICSLRQYTLKGQLT